MSRRTTALVAAALAVVCGASTVAGPPPASGRPASHVGSSERKAGPDNGRIFFSTGFLVAFPEYDGSAQVYSVRANGSDLKQLTHVPDGSAAGAPSVSPDGRTVAYTSNESGTFELMLMSRSGTHQRTILTDPDTDYLMPSWSPTGHRLVLSACDITVGFEGWCDLVTVRRDGTHQATVVGGHRYHSGGQYSPDGRWIEFQSDRAGLVGAIWIVRSTGGTPRRVTPPAMEAFLGTWTPDGRHILFADNCCQPHSNLYTITRAGRHLRQLTHVPVPHNAVNGSYSPDGRLIAFAGDALRPEGSPKSDLFTMRADGTHVTRIVKSVGPVFQSSWSPVPAPARTKGAVR
jgi:Tol biopolymer transport system component